MPLRRRPQTPVPVFSPSDTPAHQVGLDAMRNRLAQGAAGPMGLLLGQGGRDRAAKAISRWLKPVSGMLPMGAALGLPTSYGQGETALHRAMMLASRGQADERDYGNLYREIMGGPFEDSRGVLSPRAAGYGFNRRAMAVQQMADLGLLPEMESGRVSSTDSRRIADRVGNYLNAAAAMQEDMGGTVQENIARMAQQGLAGNVPDEELPTLVRMQQMMSRWRRGTA